MARAHGHQAFAHIAARADAHAQPVAGMLVDKGPVGARQHPPFGFGHGDGIARPLGARVEDHLPAIG